MHYDLAQLTRRTNPGIRRRAIVIRDIAPPGTLATDLFRACYLPVIEAWQRAADTIVEEYSRTLGSIATDARSDAEAGDPPPELHARLNDSASDIQARIDAAGSEVERLFLRLTAALEDFSLRMERWQRSKWSSAVLTATGVSIDTLLGAEDVRAPLSSWLAWNADLVRDVSNQTRQRISNAVFSGMQNRTPARDVAKQISEATGLARKRAKNIAIDQTSKLAGALADERQRQAGITQVKWRSSHKLHARKHHAARDGKIYYLETKTEVGGGETVKPGDWVSQPPWCGCRTQAVLVWMD